MPKLPSVTANEIIKALKKILGKGLLKKLYEIPNCRSRSRHFVIEELIELL